MYVPLARVSYVHLVRAHLAMCEGDDGIPLWSVAPTIANIPRNVVVTFLEPYEPCVILLEMDDGTCLVAFNGFLAFAVTECLVELFT
jgi:hypothetical protein